MASTAVGMLFAIGFYAAALILVLGLVWKIARYIITPAPLKIPVTPAPVTWAGVPVRLGQEILFFASLFKSNKWIWIFAVLFHAALLLVVLRHLRYFIEPVWFWVALAQPFGIYAGFAMVLGLLGLWGRRFLVDRVKYISSPSDHLMLALLVMIGLSGLLMKFVSRTDIIQVKTFFLGLLKLDIQALPTDPLLLAHLTLVLILLIVFPFSKLLHAPGIVFMPSRYQVDNAREKRHIVRWVAKMMKQMDADDTAAKQAADQA
ncbi:MAG: nitrate reductase [Hyphomicrobiales bacterium]|nr:MAG: nitrate reductase [Hyphomicrobiales bacterium]